MGQVCAGALGNTTSITRDPADKTLDRIVMARTKVPDFDELFKEASGPSNSLVDINNAVVEAIENIKEASAIVQGEGRVVLETNGKIIRMTLFRMDSRGAEKPIEQNIIDQLEMQKNETLSEAQNAATEAMDKMNEALGAEGDNPTEWKIQNNRMKIIKSGDADEAIKKFAVALFVYRKELLTQAHKPGILGAIEVFKRELGKKVKELGPKIRLDEDGKPDLVFGEMAAVDAKGATKKFPPRTRRLKQCFEQFCAAACKAVETVPAIQKQLERLVEKANACAENITSAINEANLGPGDAMKAGRRTHSNLKLVTGGLPIAKCLLQTLKEVTIEMQQACENPIAP